MEGGGAIEATPPEDHAMRPVVSGMLALAVCVWAGVSSARADGLLVPRDRSLPPLSLVHQRVNVTIEGQVATTSVEQVYHNATSRDLEADYLFPLPPGAAVREFAMWVNGQRLRGETVEASQARKTYEEIVRRLHDPGLLEYVDRDLWKVRIFPVPHQGEQKIEIKFTTLLRREGDLISYEYPLRTGSTPRTTLHDFTLVIRLKSEDALGPIYSPTHDVAVNRKGDNEATLSFERSHYTLDRDFTFYFAPKAKDVGLSLLTQRSSSDRQGYFLLLLSPRADADVKSVPRDLVVVLDTSHSMAGEKLRQAKGALKSALSSLKPNDRFALIQFATVVTPFRDRLLSADSDNLSEARAWVEKLEALGATDIGSALDEALKLRPSHSEGRTFQIVFFTDGLPTAGPDSKQILKLVQDRDLSGVRVFTFGVGDDVDAHLLDQLAEATRGASTYVRPNEDLEQKASALVTKISHPVRTDLKLRVGADVRLVEVYPPKLPDLFRGEQLQVAGRYEGDGHVSLTLESRVADRELRDTYEVNFPQTASEHDFIAPLWARRKVGYLLDQIRLHGESAELRDEVIRLAREFGIATPYTSLLVVPDDQPRLAGAPGGSGQGMASLRHGYSDAMSGYGPSMAGNAAGYGRTMTQAVVPAQPPPTAIRQRHVERRFKDRVPSTEPGQEGQAPGQVDQNSLFLRERAALLVGKPGAAGAPPAPAEYPPVELFGRMPTAESGKAAIDLAQQLAALKSQSRAEPEAMPVKTIAGHRFLKIEDIWIDEQFDASAKTLKLEAFGDAYFRLLEKHPELKAVLALGSRVVWVSPSGRVLVIDKVGQDKVDDAELDRLFTAAK
jgi:Ca-activated chloride channel family protein